MVGPTPSRASVPVWLLLFVAVLSRAMDASAQNLQATGLGVQLSTIGDDKICFGRRRGGWRGQQRLLSSSNNRFSSSPYRPVRFHGSSPSDFFVPDKHEEEEEVVEDFDYSQKKKQQQQQHNEPSEAEENALERAGMRPWKLDLAPRYGHMSLASKLILTNIACYGLQLWKPQITRFGAKQSDLILSGRELYRLVTPVFLHGGIGHLFMNSYSLSNIGPEVERLFGPTRFLATYFAAGVTGNILSAIRSPAPSVGASSAIFGLMGAYYMCLTENETFFGSYGQRGVESVMSAVIINGIFGAINPMIDNWGHIGGAIGGAACAYAFGPKLYNLDTPSGGSIVVDKPRYLMPQALRSLPDKFERRFGRMKRRMRVEQYQSELTAKPWRPKRRRRSFAVPPASKKHRRPRSHW